MTHATDLPRSVSQRTRRLALALALGGLLYLLYLLTFSGVFRADDERLLVDAANSLVLWGSRFFSQTAGLWGLRPVDTELNQPLLAAPLYWLAYHTPWVGNIHAIFLFNLIVTALTAILLFYYVLDLGYPERTALVGLLLFGLATIAWPYAQTFFREPLTALTLIAAAFFLERWRRAFVAGVRGHWKWLAFGVGLTVLALLSKEAALLVLPALAAYAYPGLKTLKQHHRTLIIVGIGLVALALAFAVVLLLVREQLRLFASRYLLGYQLGLLMQGLPHMWEGFAGLLISPGKGLWWYSPVLFLALAAPLALPRHRWRESWLPLALTVWMAFIYAAVKGGVWSGGGGWGPRFLVPLTPFLILAALPLIHRMLESSRVWPRIALAGLGLLGLMIQVGGVYVNLNSYYAQIEAGTGQYVWLGPAIWTFRWSQAFGSLLFLPKAPTDLLWLTPTPHWPEIGLLLAGLAVMAVIVISIARRQAVAPRLAWVDLIFAPALAAALTLVALWRAYDDPRYQSNIPELDMLRTFLYQNTVPRDVIMLSTPTYQPYFLNYYKGGTIWYTLPISPGERYSWEQQPAVVSDRVEDLISPLSVGVFQAYMAGGNLYRGGSIWLLVDSGPFHPWSTRPPEWYLAKYAYTVGVTEFSPTVRLVEYLPLAAPDIGTAPAHPLDAHFGDSIQLVGYDLVTGDGSTALDGLHAGDRLGLSLVWQAAAPPAADYTVGVYLLRSDGSLVMQQDRWPVGGFAPTSRWAPGERLRDNYGFILPAALPPGDYQLVVAIYLWPSLERLPVTSPQGENWGDHAVLGTISVH